MTLQLVAELEHPSDPESYANGSLAINRDSHVGQVEGEGGGGRQRSNPEEDLNGNDGGGGDLRYGVVGGRVLIGQRQRHRSSELIYCEG